MTSYITAGDHALRGLFVRQGLDTDSLTVNGNDVVSGGPTGPTGAVSTVPGPTGPTGASVTGPTGPAFADSVGNALTAAGTTIADALQLTHDINVVTTATSGTGVILLATPSIGEVLYLLNDGANPIKVYATTHTIDGVAGSTGVTLTNAKRAMFFYIATNTWKSAQMGVASA